MVSSLRQLLRVLVRVSISATAVRFVAVGVLCLLLAEALLYLLVDWVGVDQLWSGAISVEVSVVANFVINDSWTFRRDRPPGGFFSRMLKFHLTRIFSIALNLVAYSFMVSVLDLNYLLSYFIATVLAFSVNYLTSVLWIWKGSIDRVTGQSLERPASSRKASSAS